MVALTNTWWPLPLNSVTRTWNCRVTEVYYFQSNIFAARAPCALFSFSDVRRIAPGRGITRREIVRDRENSQEENTGWQNRVRGGNIDNFSSRRYAHFCASVTLHACRSIVRRPSWPGGSRNFRQILAFSFVYALSVGPFVVCNRAPLVLVSESEVYVTLPVRVY